MRNFDITYFNGTTIWVVSLVEKLGEELFVESVDGIVEGQQDQLRNFFFAMILQWSDQCDHESDAATYVWSASLSIKTNILSN